MAMLLIYQSLLLQCVFITCHWLILDGSLPVQAHYFIGITPKLFHMNKINEW